MILTNRSQIFCHSWSTALQWHNSTCTKENLGALILKECTPMQKFFGDLLFFYQGGLYLLVFRLRQISNSFPSIVPASRPPSLKAHIFLLKYEIEEWITPLDFSFSPLFPLQNTFFFMPNFFGWPKLSTFSSLQDNMEH